MLRYIYLFNLLDILYCFCSHGNRKQLHSLGPPMIPTSLGKCVWWYSVPFSKHQDDCRKIQERQVEGLFQQASWQASGFLMTGYMISWSWGWEGQHILRSSSLCGSIQKRLCNYMKMWVVCFPYWIKVTF